MKILKEYIIFFIFFCATLIAINLPVNIVQAEGEAHRKVINLSQAESVNSSIFNNDMLVSPGDNLAKEFYINNNNKFKCSINNISIEGSLFDSGGKVIDKSEDEYNDFLNNCTITFYCESKELFKGTLSEFLNLDLSGDKLINLEKNETKKCTMEYEVNESAGNSIMGMEYKFDITFSYSEVAGLIQTGQMIDFKALILIGTFLICIGLSQIFRKNAFKIV